MKINNPNKLKGRLELEELLIKIRESPIQLSYDFGKEIEEHNIKYNDTCYPFYDYNLYKTILKYRD